MSSSVVPNSEIDGPGSARNYTWRIRSLFWYVLTSSAAHYTLLLFPFKKKLKKYTHVLCTFAYSIYSPQAANLIPFSLSLYLSIAFSFLLWRFFSPAASQSPVSEGWQQQNQIWTSFWISITSFGIRIFPTPMHSSVAFAPPLSKIISGR